ncbi:V-set domain-containing T-cell activation inhibitor 1-like [Pagrus major]|uniref:V-set domain-containing T-cell activation inhibitor 1-like n=1 Tax=Pagrus major TaxID=143350 RepID=UPI003CC8A27A
MSPKQMIPPEQLLRVIVLFMGLMVACGDPGEDPVLQCPNTIIGEDGDTVILPCSTKDKMDLSLEQVEWFFEDPTTRKYETVHAYFQHKDYLQEQRDDFINRTSLFKEELSSGNCSLSLKETTSHSGRYHCHVPGHQSCNVTLKVHPKGKNNTSQNHQEGTASPGIPNNGTDKQPETFKAIGGVGGVVGVVVAAFIALVVYLCRRRRKHLYSGRKPKISQTYLEVSDQAQQPSLKTRTRGPK